MRDIFKDVSTGAREGGTQVILCTTKVVVRICAGPVRAKCVCCILQVRVAFRTRHGDALAVFGAASFVISIRTSAVYAFELRCMVLLGESVRALM
jgi:hypothetical protein